MKPMQISDALARIVGSKPLPRTEVTKKLWEYIKKNKLQDSVNKRDINADENLKAVFDGKEQGLDVRDDQARKQASQLKTLYYCRH